MEKEINLQSIYESNYLNPQSNREVVSEGKKKDDEKDTSKKFKSKKKKGKKITAGQMYCDSHSFDNMFDKILKNISPINEEDENYGFDDASSDDDFGTDFDADSTDDFSSDDEQTFTLSELKAMTLQEIADLISGGGVSDVDDFDNDFEEGGDFEDEIPTESTEGVYYGDQGNYDGKANRQGKSSHVKDNGDANFSDQDTGYDPEDTEGSEGSYHGDQGNYDGKANRQGKSSHVKDNGDANTGKSQNTGYKTGSGKGKNFF